MNIGRVLLYTPNWGSRIFSGRHRQTLLHFGRSGPLHGALAAHGQLPVSLWNPGADAVVRTTTRVAATLFIHGSFARPVDRSPVIGGGIGAGAAPGVIDAAEKTQRRTTGSL